MDIDSRRVVVTGEEEGKWGKRDQISGDRRNLSMGVYIQLCCTVETYWILLTSITQKLMDGWVGGWMCGWMDQTDRQTDR